MRDNQVYGSPVKCEFFPEKDCPFPYKCQSIGCRYDPIETQPTRYRLARLPWQSKDTIIKDY
jgi:hypothetical protein